jgi:hypothetical protein
MSDNWILDSIREAEKEAIARSIELHREANSEHNRAMLLHKAAEQLEHNQSGVQELIPSIPHSFIR